MVHAEASARSVEAAVTAAAADLGLRSDQVEVEVLQDPVTSTFGVIGSPARVRVTARTGAPITSTAAAPGAPPAAAAPAPVEAPAPATASDTLLVDEPEASEEPEARESAVVAAGSTGGDRTGSSGAVGRETSDEPTGVVADGVSGSGLDRPAGSEIGTVDGEVAEPEGAMEAPGRSGLTEAARVGPPAAAAPAASVGSTGVAETVAMAEPVAPAAADAPPSTAPARPPTGTSAEPASPPRRDYRDEPVEPEMVGADTERAGDFLEGLLDALDVDGDITTWVDEVGGHIDLEGSELDGLVGHNGETLDALQELTRLAVLRQSKRRVRLLLDINGFRAKQREQLVAVVKATVEEVLQTREDQELRPMTPAERKIVHDAVAAIDGAQTESLGEEPNRRVVIRPT